MTSRPVVSPAAGRPTTPAVLRLSVVDRRRRLDVVAPSALPVAELVPELVLGIGAGDLGASVRLQTVLGEVLDPALGLADQGVVDGAVLVLLGEEHAPAEASDDLPDAVAEVVRRRAGTAPVPLPATTAWLAGGLLALGACTLLAVVVAEDARARAAPGAASPGLVAVVAVAASAAVLLAVEALRRARSERPLARGEVGARAWSASAYAAVVGVGGSAAAGRAGYADAVPAAGLAVLVIALGCLAGAGGSRRRLLAPVLVGAVGVATGTLRAGLGLEPGVTLLVAATLAVLVLRLVPARLVGALPGAGPTAAEGAPTDPDGRRPRDLARLEDDVRAALELVTACAAATAVLTAVVTPVAVGRGVTGTMLALSAGLVLALQARHHRDRGVVLACLGGGAAVFVTTGVALVVQRPAAVPALAAVAVLAGVVALRTAGATWSPRSRRTADQAETLAVLALLPLLVIALDVPPLLASALR